MITWADGKLDCSGVSPISAVPIEIKGNFTGDRPYQLYYAMTPLDLRARFQMWETNDLLSVKINGGGQGSDNQWDRRFRAHRNPSIKSEIKCAHFPEYPRTAETRSIPGHYGESLMGVEHQRVQAELASACRTAGERWNQFSSCGYRSGCNRQYKPIESKN